MKRKLPWHLKHRQWSRRVGTAYYTPASILVQHVGYKVHHVVGGNASHLAYAHVLSVSVTVGRIVRMLPRYGLIT